MMKSKRAGVSVAVFAGAALVLSGCASSGVTPSSSAAYTESIAPIQNTPVASTELNAIPGTQVQQASIGQPAPLVPGQPAPGSIGGQPGTQVASTNGGLTTLNAPGSVPSASTRDLTTGLTVEKLLGGWTVVSGNDQCKLNLTQTTKVGTSRYRASTPGCSLPGLSVVASWQLLGNQVQLYDENGDIVASLILSGNRFIGTLAGGQGISLVG